MKSRPAVAATALSMLFALAAPLAARTDPPAGAAAAAPAEEAPPPVSDLYVFTPAHAGRRQIVEVGTRVEIQLPGEPGVWRLHLVSSPAVVASGPPRVVPNAGRVAGAASLYLFDFEVRGPAVGVAIQLELVHPGSGVMMSRYKVTLDALETQ